MKWYFIILFFVFNDLHGHDGEWRWRRCPSAYSNFSLNHPHFKRENLTNSLVAVREGFRAIHSDLAAFVRTTDLADSDWLSIRLLLWQRFDIEADLFFLLESFRGQLEDGAVREVLESVLAEQLLIEGEFDALRKALLSDPIRMKSLLVAEALSSPDDYDDLSTVDWVLNNLASLRVSEPHKMRYSSLRDKKQLGYGPTRSVHLAAIFAYLKLTPLDVFVDIGSGYGRVCLYGGLTEPAEFFGIERIPTRANLAIAAAAEHKLSRVHFIVDDIRHQPDLLNRATVFYLFYSLSPEDFYWFAEELRTLLPRTGAKVVVYEDWAHFEACPWLVKEHEDVQNQFAVFRIAK